VAVRVDRLAGRASRLLVAVAVAVAWLTTMAVAPASAYPAGSLDTTFGTGGVVVTQRTGDDTIMGLALQPDGKVVTVGSRATVSLCCAIQVTRFLRDGSLDPTFGAGGYVDLAVPGYGDTVGFAIGIQADGKIVVAGGFAKVVVARLNPDGTLDPSFAFGGITTSSIGQGGGVLAGARQLAIGADGSVFISAQPYGDPRALVVVKLRADGFVDPSFGTGGIAMVAFPDPFELWSTGLAVDRSGRILAAVDGYRAYVVRLQPDGRLDGSFGIGGRVVSSLSNISDLALDAFGRPVVSGTAEAGSFGVARLTLRGFPDASFGVKGLAVGRGGTVSAIAIRGDGAIMAAGGAVGGDVIESRFDTRGRLDRSFGDDGVAAVTIGGQGSGVVGVVVRPDGATVVGGWLSLLSSPAYGRTVLVGFTGS
jgi:uncharacterized delta-60 repeat protein